MRSTRHDPDLDDSVYDRFRSERIVVLGQEVDDAVANRIVVQLLLLAAEDPTRDITIYVNSPGGSVTAGLTIYDTMNSIEPDVSTVATGMAASMGQFPADGRRTRQAAGPAARRRAVGVMA